MTETQNKEKEIRQKIEQHEALIESLRTHLKETQNNKAYGPTKGYWLKTVQACTSPFAKLNKSIESYLADPDLHNLEKDILKLQDICIKFYKNQNKLDTQNKITKAQLKLSKLKEKILANPAYISQKYSDEMNVKETLDEAENLQNVLFELIQMISAQILT